MPDSALLPDNRVMHIGRVTVERDLRRFLWRVDCPGMRGMWAQDEADAVALAEVLAKTPHDQLMTLRVA